MIDHVAKDRASAGRWAVGAGQKLALIDGAAFGLEVLNPLGRGRNGQVRITLAKDRPGALRRHVGADDEIARFRLSSRPDGSVTSELLAPAGPAEAGDQRIERMARVAKVLEDAGEPLSKVAVEGRVGGKRDHVRVALAGLVEVGCVEVLPGRGGSQLHRSVRTFRPQDEHLAPPRPRDSGRGAGDLALAALSIRERDRRGEVTAQPARPQLDSTT